MTVKRYTPTQCCEHDGTYVTYSDYQKLVAENAALKSFGNKLDEMHNDLIGEGTGIQGKTEVAIQQAALEAVMEEFDAIETPATDAAIAEIKAQGVALAISHLSKKFTNLGVPITSLEWLEVELRAGSKG